MNKLRVLVVAAITASGFAALSTTTGQAAPAPDTALVSAALSADRTDLSGAELGQMTVSLHLTDPAGVQPTPTDFAYRQAVTCPCAYLSLLDTDGYTRRASTQAYSDRVVSLSLTSGDATDGTWSGHTTIGAINAGHWQLRAIIAGSLTSTDNYYLTNSTFTQMPWLPVDGQTLGATVDVTGHNWPIMTFDKFGPAVAEGTPYRFSGQVHFVDTGEPAANLPITVAPDLFFVYGVYPARHLVTDSDGRWSTSYAAPENGISVGYGDDGQASLRNVAGFKQVYVPFKTAYWVVTIHASSTHAPATISGAVLQHDVNRGVQLQKLVGRVWKTVQSHTLSQTSNRYSFRVTAAGTYRVHADAGSAVIRGYSKTVRLS